MQNITPETLIIPEGLQAVGNMMAEGVFWCPQAMYCESKATCLTIAPPPKKKIVVHICLLYHHQTYNYR